MIPYLVCHNKLFLLLVALTLLTACAAPRERVVLLDAAGTLSVTTTRQTTTLTQPYATAQVRPDGRVQAGTTTPAQVQQRYGAVLATLPEPGRLFTLHFETGTAQLTPASQAEVPALLAEVARRGACEVLLEGHTDSQGTDAVNDPLSLARAEAVRQLLALPPGAFVRVVGRGSRVPVVDAPGQAEPRNRRVVVTVR